MRQRKGKLSLWMLHAVTTTACRTCLVATYSSRMIFRTRLTMLPTDACSGSDLVSFLPSAMTNAMSSLQNYNVSNVMHQTTTTTLLTGYSRWFNNLLCRLPVSMGNDLLQQIDCVKCYVIGSPYFSETKKKYMMGSKVNTVSSQQYSY
jgi:hypothetical protein